MKITDFRLYKDKRIPITMLTCYDYTSAVLLAGTDVDCLLVGDSMAMVMQGCDSTIHADIPMLCQGLRSVRRGCPEGFIIADMPFLSYRKGRNEALEAAGRLLVSGADAVKLENVRGHEQTISHLIASGIPVMGHVGMTPQSSLSYGGFRLQGKREQEALAIMSDALELERLGCFSLVIECVPTEVAKSITESLAIPTIGIGAGPATDGQVLVLQDMLGLTRSIKPKFVKHYLDGGELVQEAVGRFVNEVRSHQYPSDKESYHL